MVDLGQSETGSPAVVRLGALPNPATPLIGRAPEIAEVLATFADGARLQTLIGTGGVGKTRLAIAVGQAWPGPVRYVPLASLTDATLVPTAIVEAFGAAASQDAQVFTAIEAACDAGTLLILDNLEHVLESASFIGALLTQVPDVCILTTSRRRLRLEAEHAVDVAPLDTDSSDSPAVRLFIDRAHAHHSAVTLPSAQLPYVRGICERLDGLPLAIELAARSAHLIAPETMLRRLESGNDLPGSRVIDQSPRHSTLLATIAWSLELLTPTQQRWWEMLSVFQGGCTVEAATDVAQRAGLPEADEIDTVDALVDAGLVRITANRIGEPRIVMLDTTLRVARRLLGQSLYAAEVTEAHLAWIQTQVVVFDEGIRGESSSIWQVRIDADMPNVRQATDRLLHDNRTEEAMRIIGTLEWHWTLPPNLIEGRRWTDDLLAKIQPEMDRTTVAKLWDTAGSVADWQADTAYARHCFEQSLAIWRDLGRDDRIGYLLLGLSSTALDAMAFEPALVDAREAIERSLASRDVWNQAAANNLAGTILVPMGRQEEAIVHYEEAYRLYDAGGFDLHIRNPLHGLADAYIGLGRLGTAVEYLDAGLALCDGDELVSQTPAVFLNFAQIAVDLREWEMAVRLCGAVAAQRRILGIPARPHKVQQLEAIVATATGRLGRARAEHLRKEGAAMTFGDLRTMVEVLRPSDAAETGGLSRRELDVLALLSEGASDADIADRLFITRRTASKHVASILGKLDAANRTAAATLAIRRGLI